MILKMWWKIKFVLCQPRYYNLLAGKKVLSIQEILFKHDL